MEKNLFHTGKPNKRLADAISIKNPNQFRESISKLKTNGLSLKERRALILAQNRAKAQLGRKNLSIKERKQMREISHISIPKK